MDTNYSPQHPYENELEKLAEFADLCRGVERLEYADHPSEDILRAYVANRLLDGPGAGRVGASFRDEQAFEQFARGRVARWTRPDVSMHILTCARCQQSVSRLRASRWQLLSSARHPTEERSWRRRLALGALASAAVAAIVAALWLWPPSTPGPACWIEEQCWQQVIRESSSKGSILMSYRQPGRF